MSEDAATDGAATDGAAPDGAAPDGAAPAADRHWMGTAIDLARRCPVTERAYSVGAVIVDADGQRISTGYSREAGPHVHAEEAALAKVTDADRPRLAGATLYTTLEPCSTRHTPTTPCAQLTIAAGIRRVVLAWREPDHFVICQGVALLAQAGVRVVELPDFAEAARQINSHLPV
jgi:diaminohydroxyphosphoribosylaminopyrimidine deaminase/5-amino-6-(5-phosphoribosylamino)uracil reductase